MFRNLVVATLLVVGLQANAFQVNKVVNWGNIQEAMFLENQTFQGNWQERNDWKSTFCSSAFYTYNLGLKAILDDVKLGLQEDGAVNAFVRIGDIFGSAKGSLKNGGTFCQELKANVGVGIEWAEVKANISFGETGTLDEMAIQVTSTRLGKLELGKYFPNWFEDMLTGVANRGLAYIWKSRIGGWLNKKITEVAKKHIPQQAAH